MKTLRFARHSAKALKLHSMFAECEKKYCKAGDELILACREAGKHRIMITVRSELFHELLRVYRQRKEKEYSVEVCIKKSED